MSYLILPTLRRSLCFPSIFQLHAAVRSTHWHLKMAGNREQVGYGVNGNPIYFDASEMPFPAVRWKEPTPELCCLWEKEKGDWGKLTREEKKELYRASFRQTFAEFQAPSPEWKIVLAMLLHLISVSLLLHYLTYSIYPTMPDTFCESKRQAQLRRILDLQQNPVFGVSSKWDYEKDTWK
ncbi:cytochrome c oxidase subunit 4 isoform 1, mitochondrial-like [Coccinella septempunctata]|uniref:cytochrome c oxidase subunit 4 isoform 1, mitochondrial-like n=1 Tax=Coccinella septempunctata TaxID=41139 RepID=UPI001D08B2CA|nr:cytochrome c oxidase subunit 4 isoform 1, mitochondrial-like [Coccinella septempunctata]